MPQFQVTGKGKDTGRKRKRTYSAFDENDARLLAEKDGTLVEAIAEIPPEPASDRQLEYARDLGISIPRDPTMAALSDLISLKVEGDKPSTPRHRQFAKRFKVETTHYVGKRALFDRIQIALSPPGREVDLLSWFAYRVYRELVHGADDAQIETPDDPVIQSLARQLVKDEKIVESVRRYEGRSLIWFGEWTSPDGNVYTGGSNRTTAYKAVSSRLKDHLGLSERVSTNERPVPASSKKDRSSSGEPRGCLSVVILALLVPSGVVAYVALL